MNINECIKDGKLELTQQQFEGLIDLFKLDSSEVNTFVDQNGVYGKYVGIPVYIK